MFLRFFLFLFFVSANAFAQTENTQVATFAGGCFWCMEPPFDKLEGVKKTTSGFMGGSKENPSYKEVAKGRTKHIEAIQIEYDPKVVSYEKLLEVFWRQINPTDAGGQFVDRGHQYSTAIFFHNKQQKQLAETSLQDLESSKIFKKPIVTVIREATDFFPAEDYHQDYYQKNPIRYKYYRWRSGRDQFLKKTWKGKDS